MMSARVRLGAAGLVLGGLLVFSLLGVVSSGASAKTKGKVVSGKLTPKTSFTAAQATATKLVCRFSPASTRVVLLLSVRTNAKWVKVRSVTKKGTFKTYATTVKKLFGAKAVNAGQYRIKISADANSLTRTFTVTAVTGPSSSDGASDASGDEGSGSSSGSGSRGGSGDCGEDCDEGSGDDGSGDGGSGGDDGGSPAPVAPGAFSKTSPSNGATGQLSSVTLSWSVSSNAASYQYCVDSTPMSGSRVCHIPSTGVSTGWVSASSTTAAVSGLIAGKIYYWQVSAYNAPYGTYADGGTWFSFTVSP